MFAPVSFLEPGYPYFPTPATSGEFYNNITNWSSLGTANIVEAATSPASGNMNYSGVLGKDGNIYGVPFNNPNVFKIDTTTNTVSNFATVSGGSAKYGGGALAANGKIYCCPFNQNNILEINTDTQTVRTFGEGSFGPFTAKFAGAVAHPNGKIYFIPLNVARVLELDPSNDSFQFIGTTFGTSDAKWLGGVIGLDGKIYCAPYNNTAVLRIDVDTKTTDFFGSFSGDSKWVGIYPAPNGKLYTIPFLATGSIKIDPINTGSITNIPIDVAPFKYKWYGGDLGIDGNIYGNPINSTSSLVINTTNDTVSEIGQYGGVGTEKFTSLVGAGNGKLYHIPYNTTASVIYIEPNGTGKNPSGGPLSDMVKGGYLNNF